MKDDRSAIIAVAVAAAGDDSVSNVSLGRQCDRDPTVSPPGHGANPGSVGSPRDKHFAVLPQIGGEVAEGNSRWLWLCFWQQLLLAAR